MSYDTSPTHTPAMYIAHAQLPHSLLNMNRDYLTYGVLAGVGAGILGGGLYWLVKKMKKVSLCYC